MNILLVRKSGHKGEHRGGCPGNSGVYEKCKNAGNIPGMVKTFCGRNGDLGGRGPKLTLIQTLCGLSMYFNLSEFWLPNQQKWIGLRIKLSKLFIKC